VLASGKLFLLSIKFVGTAKSLPLSGTTKRCFTLLGSGLTLWQFLILLIHIFQWKGINCKQNTRWQHLSRLKASAFFSLQKKISCHEKQQLILGTGNAIWWVTEPLQLAIFCNFRYDPYQNLVVKFQRFFNSTFSARPNFISFCLVHEQILSLCMNIAVA
jgi:hypothetical protein